MADIVDAKTKQKVSKPTFSSLEKKSKLKANLRTLATKAKLKAEQDKIVKLKPFDSRHFHGKFVLRYFGYKIGIQLNNTL